MAMDECKKAESGKHEPDWERLTYETHIGADSARFGTRCIHCGVDAEFQLYNSDAVWGDDRE